VTSDGADTRKNLTPNAANSPAIAFASFVLPVPDGPHNSTPLGGSTPKCVYISGWMRGHSTSCQKEDEGRRRCRIAATMHLLYLFQHSIDAAYIAELHLTTALPCPARTAPSPPPFPSSTVPTTRRPHPALTLGVIHGPNSSSSATSPPPPTNLRRFFSVAAAVSSLRRRLEEVSVEAAAAAAAAAVALGAGVEGAAEDRLRCCRDGSLPTTFSILSAQKQRKGKRSWKTSQRGAAAAAAHVFLIAWSWYRGLYFFFTACRSARQGERASSKGR
jgi:hypothetical protein